MIPFKTESIEFPLSFQAPGTIEEYNAKAGVRVSGLPAVLEDALGAVNAWSTLPEWQQAFAEALTKKYADRFVREVNVKATETKKAAAKSDEAKAKAVVYETITKSVKRFVADLTEDEKKEVATLAQSVADSIEIDPSPSKRAGAPKKDYLAKADTWLSLTDDELEAKVTAGTEAGANADLIVRGDDGRPTRDSLARFIGAYIDAMAAGL